jgi:hypothetical protein
VLIKMPLSTPALPLQKPQGTGADWVPSFLRKQEDSVQRDEGLLGNLGPRSPHRRSHPTVPCCPWKSILGHLWKFPPPFGFCD